MSKHTTGPWKYVEGGWVDSTSTPNVAYCGQLGIRTAEEQIANGKLIAAAPDLLEACQALPIGILDHDFIDAADFKDNAEPFLRAMRLARRAIAKATGGQP